MAAFRRWYWRQEQVPDLHCFLARLLVFLVSVAVAGMLVVGVHYATGLDGIALAPFDLLCAPVYLGAVWWLLRDDRP